MKAITIYEPWASLIALGAKTIETRSWPTKYRGPIAIHVAKKPAYWLQFDHGPVEEPFASALAPLMPTDDPVNLSKIDWHLGCVIAIADLVDCVKVVGTVKICGKIVRVGLQDGSEVTGNELAFGDYTPGRYAWLLANVRRIDPVPATGRQRLWEWTP